MLFRHCEVPFLVVADWRSLQRKYRAVSRTAEGRIAAKEYSVTSKATDEKTAKLRAMRRAKEQLNEVLTPKRQAFRATLHGVRSDGPVYRRRTPFQS